MCGRFLRVSSLAEVVEAFDATGEVALTTSFNVPPTTSVYVIRHDETRRVVEPMSWGLVPFWAKDQKRASNAINARAETLTEKPTFRHLVSRHRSVMPLDGYYEWDTVSVDKGGPKQPYLVRPSARGGLEHRGMFAAASLWSTWRDPEDEEVTLLTVAMVTTESTGVLSGIHHRMPLLLDESELEEWLDPEAELPSWVASARRDPHVEMIPVSTRVNSVRNNDESLLHAINLEGAQDTLF
jgi:putative SOS response-associated peptidase YedK